MSCVPNIGTGSISSFRREESKYYHRHCQPIINFTMKLLKTCAYLYSLALTAGFSFKAVETTRGAWTLEASRRDFMNDVAVAPAAMVFFSFLEPANGSGGATAGGAYLLSAKQRYNERVKEAIKGLLVAEEGLAAGNSKDAKAYFAAEDAGSWKDLTAAGYLLSNAFRRSSTTAPDR